MRQGFRRVAVPQQAAARAKPYTFPAPTRGWVENENLAKASRGAARVLENWFPTQTGARLRAGAELTATIGEDPVECMFTYVSGAVKKLFASDEENVFDLTVIADPEVAPTADITGQTSGYYSSTQFETAAGDFLYIFNGTDSAQLYDGTSWVPITNVATYGIPFDAQTGNFTVGQVVTGGTSGATATIVAQTDDGTTGTLEIQGITGTFQDNETITDPLGGSADAAIPTGVTTIQGVAITGVATANISHIWVYRSRIWLIEVDSMSAWYLPVDSLGGAATEFSLRGVFRNGGSLLLGATWSLDAGDGLDDKIVFVSTEGELAVFQGSSPAEDDWYYVGRYEITAPLGKKSTMQAGGDLLIATKDGIVPVSQALIRDKAALSLAAVSRAIEPSWKENVATRKSLPWEILKWPSANMAIVSLPVIDATTLAQCFVVNLETGAWAKYTGWDTRCLALHDDWAYFGTSTGTVLKCEATGSDNGESITHTYVGLPDPVSRRDEASTKLCHLARATFLAGRPFTPKVSVSTNYAVSLPTAPDAYSEASGSDLWDVGLWDVAMWSGTGERSAVLKWVGIDAAGFAIAPQVQVATNQTGEPDAELISFSIMYESAGVVI